MKSQPQFVGSLESGRSEDLAFVAYHGILIQSK